jgi:hypothetical protein
MYNLSQLNDMLVLELNDIADQFNITNSKDLSRTDLIAAIMEKQPGSQEVKNDADGADKPKRKRIVKEPVKKGATSNPSTLFTEELVNNQEEIKIEKPIEAPAATAKPKKVIAKKPKTEPVIV